jgi:hypothetical protein
MWFQGVRETGLANRLKSHSRTGNEPPGEKIEVVINVVSISLDQKNYHSLLISISLDRLMFLHEKMFLQCFFISFSFIALPIVYQMNGAVH